MAPKVSLAPDAAWEPGQEAGWHSSLAAPENLTRTEALPGLPATHQAEISSIIASYRLGPARLGGNGTRPEDGCGAAGVWWAAARSPADSDIGESVRALPAALAASPSRAASPLAGRGAWDGAWVIAAFMCCAAERAAVARAPCCWAWRSSATAAASAARFAISAAVSTVVSSVRSPVMASSRAVARRRSPSRLRRGIRP
jgi:hypothetical protein